MLHNVRSSEFEANLHTGRVGESIVVKYLISRGWNVLPAYEVEMATGKGPRLFSTLGPLVAPDMLAFRMGQSVWCEVKTKSAFAWNRNRWTWTTGIDKRHWLQYLKVKKISGFEIWILFLQLPGVAKDTPSGMLSPTGLYGNEIDGLEMTLDHEFPRGSDYGMVYWRIESLRRIATLEKVQNATA